MRYILSSIQEFGVVVCLSRQQRVLEQSIFVANNTNLMRCSRLRRGEIAPYINQID